MTLKKFSKLLKFIIFSKFVYRKPKKSKYLIFDQNNFSFLKKYIKEKDISILYTRGEIFNMFVIINNFLNFKFSLLDYYNSYIDCVDPKIIITFTDNDPAFYLIKKKGSRKKIMIQNAWKNEYSDSVFLLNKRNKKFNVDYILTFNNHIGKKFCSFINGKSFTIGSFKSNSYKFKRYKKKFDLLYISSYRPGIHRRMTPNLTWAEFDRPQRILVKNLKIYAKKNKMNFFICARGSVNEKEYYQNILGNSGWNFLPNNRFKSYQYIDQAKVSININSTLGYESFARGNRTAFFSIRPREKILKTVRFAWPVNIPNKGFFWTNNLSREACFKVMHNVTKCSEKKWKKIYKRYSKKIISKNENNLKFRSICFRKS